MMIYYCISNHICDNVFKVMMIYDGITIRGNRCDLLPIIYMYIYIKQKIRNLHFIQDI